MTESQGYLKYKKPKQEWESANDVSITNLEDLKMWLPHGTKIIIEKRLNGFTYTVSALGIKEVFSGIRFRTHNLALSAAVKRIRKVAYYEFSEESGYAKDRVHFRIKGQYRSYCGSTIRDNPHTNNKIYIPCSRCERIESSIVSENE